MTDSVHGLPPLMRKGLRVALVPPPLKQSRWHTVASVTQGAGQGALVAFDDVKSIADAQALVGKQVLACIDDLPADYARHDVDALLGRTVFDQVRGRTGTIDEVMRGPANDVWVVLFDTPQHDQLEEYLLPVIDEVVGEVLPAGTISVRLPEGLEPESVRPVAGAHDVSTDGRGE